MRRLSDGCQKARQSFEREKEGKGAARAETAARLRIKKQGVRFSWASCYHIEKNRRAFFVSFSIYLRNTSSVFVRFLLYFERKAALSASRFLMNEVIL